MTHGVMRRKLSWREQEFDRDNITLERIVSFMAHLLMSNNHYLIFDKYRFLFVPRLKICNEAIRRKFRNGNIPIPAADTASILDGTLLQIAPLYGP